MYRSRSLPGKTTRRKYVCDDCNVMCTSAAQLHSHRQGYKHKKVQEELEEFEDRYSRKRSHSPNYDDLDYDDCHAELPSSFYSHYPSTSLSGRPYYPGQKISKYRNIHHKDRHSRKRSHSPNDDDLDYDDCHAELPSSFYNHYPSTSHSGRPYYKRRKISKYRNIHHEVSSDHERSHSPSTKFDSEDESVLAASCDSSDDNASCSSGKESKEKPNDDQTEPCPSERSLGEGNKHSAVTYSKAEVFAFLRNFEVADKSDVTFIKTVTLLFSKALRKFQGKDLEDKECFGAEPESSVDEEDLKSPRTYSGSRSVSISIQPLHTSSHKHKDKHRRRKTYSHSSSRLPSSEHVRSTSRSSLQITIKSANVGENRNIKEELSEIVLSENDNTETLEVIDTLEENCTSNPDLEDKDDHFEMDQSVENGNPECLTAEAASSDDEDV
ncbi:uncharacterized protein LOC134607980 isoform X1 [Pelobates fuscus]|uniref:uncharacterized protein LOC134607980 isoform X1 n=1 Tax=Pelobates fuscus TaxID=191477 RepID=UPI002FE454A6